MRASRTPSGRSRHDPARAPGGRASRTKGVRAEQALVRLLRNAGIPAERVPLSGAAGGHFTGDIRLPGGWRAEVKIRSRLPRLYALFDDGTESTLIDPSARGWGQYGRWLGTADVLFVRADRMPWLAIDRAGPGTLRVRTLERWTAETRTDRLRRGWAA